MRNQERLGTQFQQNVDESVVSEKFQEQGGDGSDLSFISPTQCVELPSKGRFYPSNHPLRGKDSLDIKFMTAKSEDILVNKSLLSKGIAIDRLLHSLLVDKSIDLDSLLIGDKNAITIEARITGYGSEYKVKTSCPACGKFQESNFDLEESKRINFGEDVDGMEVSEHNTFFVMLPKSGVKVECKFLTGKDEKELMFLVEKKKKNKLPESQVTDQMKMFILSINGNSDATSINKFVDAMPAIDSRMLRNSYRKINPNLELKADFICESCQHEEEVTVPLGTEFFWPK
ncbi:MAG: hypothetical protein Q8P81_02125 [Nanoarchaeota archaeon]|nr:hypothetical protein [Nanoarchaeota archaeon]